MPKSRNNDNEIVTVAIFKELGLLAPRSRYINAVVNGTNIRYIMQEKFAKELSEINNLRESSFVRMNEELMWKVRRINNEDKNYGALLFPSVVNTNWVKKNEINKNIAIGGLNALSHAFINSQNGYIYDETLDDDILMRIKNISNNQSTEELSLFTLLLIATGSEHAYFTRNIRYYFDPFKNKLRPIYYDGNSTILEQVKDTGATINNENISNIIRRNFKDFNIAHAKQKIAELDLYSLVKRINNNGVQFNLGDAQILKETLLTNLLSIEEAVKNSIILQTDFSRKPHNNLSSDQNSLTLRNQKIANYNILYSNDSNTYYLCNGNKPHDCNQKSLSFKQSIKLIGGDKLKLNGVSSFYLNAGALNPNIYPSNMFKTKTIDENFTFRVYGDPEIKIDKSDKKHLIIRFLSPEDRIVIYDTNIVDWNITAFASIADPELTNDVRYNNSLQTGSLVIQDSTIKNSSLSFSGGSFEDSINIVRSSGSISSINIENSFQDALDIDYSDLMIEDIEIINSGNDCLDLSAGSYKVENIKLKNCSDKGVSLGENGIFSVNNLSISNSNIGIVSKDSSFAAVNNALIEKTNHCFSVYRKKQEFGGAKLVFPVEECGDIPFNVQSLSVLERK